MQALNDKENRRKYENNHDQLFKTINEDDGMERSWRCSHRLRPHSGYCMCRIVGWSENLNSFVKLI